MKPNKNYKKLESSYLFYDIEQRVKAYSAEHPDKKLLRLGVGDVTLPLCSAVIKAMYSAVEDQSKKETFHGYMPECGSEELKTAIAGYYARRGVELCNDEIFPRARGTTSAIFSICSTAITQRLLLSRHTPHM